MGAYYPGVADLQAQIDVIDTTITSLQGIVGQLQIAGNNPMPIAPTAGTFLTWTNGAAVGSSVVSSGVCYYYPMDIRVVPINVSAYNVSISGPAGGAGAVIRMGRYLDDGTTNRPGALALDYGSVAADTNGTKTVAVVDTLPVGRVWLAWVYNSGVAPAPTIRYWTGGSGNVTVGNTVGGVLTETGVAGALPAVANANDSGTFAPWFSLAVA